MKRLSKTEINRKIELATSLEEKAKEIAKHLQSCKNKPSKAGYSVSICIDEYNELISEANTFMNAIHEEQENHIGERSERWLDGDAGAIYQEWTEAWSQEFEELGDDFESINFQDLATNIVDTLMDLPDQP